MPCCARRRLSTTLQGVKRHKPTLRLARIHLLRDISKKATGCVSAMSSSDASYNFDRYRKLLAEAKDEPKRLAFIRLLIEEKAKDRLAAQILHTAVSGLGVRVEANPPRATHPGENGHSKPR
jgi:hypothetical protein